MTKKIHGVGLGLKKSLFASLREYHEVHGSLPVDFLEVAPENWIRVGGKSLQDFEWFAERYPIVCHGLSLSLGGYREIDIELVKSVKSLMSKYSMPFYTEHLSYCGDSGNIYDLLPIPLTSNNIDNVVSRINKVQDILGVNIGLENASYYVNSPISEMSEIDFILGVLSKTDAFLHLDVNNVYVNSVNFGFNPYDFIDKLPSDKIKYIHIAGHHQQSETLLIDTHGDMVRDPVWKLLEYTYNKHGVISTLLERDVNIPPLSDLIVELNKIKAIQGGVI